MLARATVTAGVTNLWTGPEAVRGVDAAMLRRHPDLDAWLAALDTAPERDDGRLGLDGRLLTQLVAGEPVQPLGRTTPDGTWVEVVCPWQPSAAVRGLTGYRGWVVAAHLTPLEQHAGAGAADRTPATRWAGPGTDPPRQPDALLGAARRYLGVPYLWAGCCPAALDCSGLVHRSARDLGIVVPRDADDQHDAARPVPLDRAEPGDLLFFARPGRRAHHVGILSGDGRMLHAPQTGAVVVDEPIGPDRAATLVAAGRIDIGSPEAGA